MEVLHCIENFLKISSCIEKWYWSTNSMEYKVLISNRIPKGLLFKNSKQTFSVKKFGFSWRQIYNFNKKRDHCTLLMFYVNLVFRVNFTFTCSYTLRKRFFSFFYYNISEISLLIYNYLLVKSVHHVAPCCNCTVWLLIRGEREVLQGLIINWHYSLIALCTCW